MSLVDDIRDLYEKKGLDAVWKFCMDGKGSQAKADRFDAYAKFAGNRKGKPKPHDPDWDVVQRRARAQRDHFQKRADQHDKPDGETPLGKFSTSLGPKHWGGSADAMYALVYPIADQFGMAWEGDDKEFGHAVGGDHDPNVTNAFAEDFPTFSGAAFANAVARKLGGSTGVGTFGFIPFTYQGVGFRAQVLWAVEGHFNHAHVGIRRT